MSSTLSSLKQDTTSSSLPSIRPISDFPPCLLSSHSRRGDDTSLSTLSHFKPIREGGRSAFTIHRPIRTQVSVEVHQQAHNRDGGNYSNNSSEELHQRLLGRLDRTYSQAFSSQSNHLSQRQGFARPANSHSLESPRQSSYKDSRQVRSHDDCLEDYDVLKITEFSKGPFYNTDYDIISELASPTSSKVRYNDTGSLEQLNEDSAPFACGLEFDALIKMEDSREQAALDDRRDQDHSEDTEDSAETLNGNRKYRALWRLRATLEEEEECSDTVRMEDLTSPDDSFEREHVTPNTTSFESNAQSEPCPSDHRDSGIQFEICSTRPLNHVNFLHPNYENRRQNYRNVMGGRFKRGNQSTSVENSFDSVETDGDISDTSRYEMTTTSFESSTTTDNTDSTNESQASKLVQMKADSGYKSLETQQQSSKEMGDHDAARWDFRASVECGEGIAARRDRRTSLERADMVCYAFGQPGAVGLIGDSGKTYPHQGMRRSSGTAAQVRCDPTWRPVHAASHFTRRDVKTASKKRREYSRERQLVHVCESIQEPAVELRTDMLTREDTTTPHKISVFARFFRSHPRGHRSQYLARDYSIDQKTNSIFNEFVRQEISPTVPESTSMPRLNRHRLQRKHTEPMLLTEARATSRDRLAPSMRSASLGSESSVGSARRISPQDSIEEKDDEMGDETVFLHRLPVWSSFRSPDINLVSRQVQTLSVHDIPVIKLSEQEVPEIT
ncbi:unnamed protein product [Candidula unifasciata]|uniref:Uncharacterized protein n=1 Tax=Candidula unifasciata TaxID=100452 RepID=A0A8S3ZVH2_9EUPU|nr:unnamed protein product [Candidula unifasciata]